ncbi:MAG: hypothetical protein M1820_004866 [Bogoriella megaspora]|nr:MAG: hypothetical protein M1820_004866 [Bogoriella megaspora]
MALGFNETKTRLPELVRDSRLETRVENDSIVHLYKDRPGRRVAPREERWKTKQKLGRGSYGTVFLLESATDSEPCSEKRYRAVKEISSQARRSLDFYRNELVAFAKFSKRKYERCFVQSFDWFETVDSLYISMEYCAFGDLQNYLIKHGRLLEVDTQEIIAQVAQGLDFVHGEGFAHRDVKPQNILIKSCPPADEWWVKICDFGLTKPMEEATGATIFGSYGFLAPELIHDKDMAKLHRYAADIWCLGETAFHLLFNQSVFSPELHELEDYYDGKIGFPSQKFTEIEVSDAAVNFISTAMAPKPADRFDAHQCLKHPWISASDNDVSEERGYDEPLSPQLNAPEGPSYYDSSTQPSGVWSTAVGSMGALERHVELRSHSWSLESTLYEHDEQESQEDPPTSQQGEGALPGKSKAESIEEPNQRNFTLTTKHSNASQQLSEEAFTLIPRPLKKAIEGSTQNSDPCEGEPQRSQEKARKVMGLDSTRLLDGRHEIRDQENGRQDQPCPEISKPSSDYYVAEIPPFKHQTPSEDTEKEARSRSASPEPRKREFSVPVSKKRTSFMQKLGFRSASSKSRTDLLCKAADDGDLSKVRTLIEAGADANGPGQNGYTPLGTAVAKTHVKIATLLLERGADVHIGCTEKWMRDSSSDAKDSSPLHLAVKHDSIELVDLLVSYGAKVNKSVVCASDNIRTVPLGLACSDAMVRVLLKHGANIAGNSASDLGEVSPLINAVKDRQVSSARAMLDHQAPVNCHSPTNRTALFYACEGESSEQSLELVKMLLAAGAHITCRKIGSISWCPISKIYSRINYTRYDVESARCLINAMKEPDEHLKQEVHYSLRAACLRFEFADMDTQLDMMEIIIFAGASMNSGQCPPLQKLFSIFTYRVRDRPEEEEAIRVMLKYWILIVRAGADVERLIRDIQHDQSQVRKSYDPENPTGLLTFNLELHKAHKYAAPVDLVKKRLELGSIFFSWTQKVKSDHGLENLEEYLHEFWDIIDKMGLGEKTQQSTPRTDESRSRESK